MTAVLLKAIRDLRRRRLPAIVIFGTTLLAVLTATMTLSLMSQARDPYQAAFDAQKGAHLQVTFDSRIDPATLAGTPGLIGAAAFGGPYPATDRHVPAGSVTDSVNYLFISSIFHVSTQVLTSVLMAFSVFALAATAAIVANLVTGIVISGYREIGIMKAVGFTPVQVVGVFELQVLVPAAAACIVGIPAGTVLGQPLVASSSQALGLAYQATFSPAID